MPLINFPTLLSTDHKPEDTPFMIPTWTPGSIQFLTDALSLLPKRHCSNIAPPNNSWLLLQTTLFAQWPPSSKHLCHPHRQLLHPSPILSLKTMCVTGFPNTQHNVCTYHISNTIFLIPNPKWATASKSWPRFQLNMSLISFHKQKPTQQCKEGGILIHLLFGGTLECDSLVVYASSCWLIAYTNKYVRALQWNIPFISSSILTFTTRIWFFVECSELCRVQNIGHSAKHNLSSATLAEQRHSATTSFVER